jgi:hypothetical protein
MHSAQSSVNSGYQHSVACVRGVHTRTHSESSGQKQTFYIIMRLRFSILSVTGYLPHVCVGFRQSRIYYLNAGDGITTAVLFAIVAVPDDRTGSYRRVSQLWGGSRRPWSPASAMFTQGPPAYCLFSSEPHSFRCLFSSTPPLETPGSLPPRPPAFILLMGGISAPLRPCCC